MAEISGPVQTSSSRKKLRSKRQNTRIRRMLMLIVMVMVMVMVMVGCDNVCCSSLVLSITAGSRSTLTSMCFPKTFPTRAVFGNVLGICWDDGRFHFYVFGSSLGMGWDIVGTFLEDLKLRFPNIRECLVNTRGVGWEDVCMWNTQSLMLICDYACPRRIVN